MADDLRKSLRKTLLLVFDVGVRKASHLHKQVVECAATSFTNVVSGLQMKGDGEAPDVRLSSWHPAQGDTLAILIALSPSRNPLHSFKLAIGQILWKESLVQVLVDGFSFPAYSISGNQNFFRTLVPTTPLDTPGPKSLLVRIKDGRHKPFVGTIELHNKDFAIESIFLSDSKAMILGTPKEMEAVEAMVASETNQQYWHGPFIQPTIGKVTSGYGLQRYYDGVYAQSYYHRGVDYAAEEGTNVQAPANGRVVLVGHEEHGFKLHGNCVGIDHGNGITSILMHLCSTLTEKGKYVKAGEVVGTVGETGLATGPHLHWGLFVHGKSVNPHQWMKHQLWL